MATQLMELPSADTPLYDHALPALEQWLGELGCQQDRQARHRWYWQGNGWQAELRLEVEVLAVRYEPTTGGSSTERSFQYSLSRADVEAAIFAAP
jgi:hypothetical protein